MSELASALTAAMTGSTSDLVLLDRDTNTWTPHPWPEVHRRAENIAERILDNGHVGAVGVVGEPTVEFVAALQGAWLAGRGISVLPGPVRGADPQLWATATLDRFASIGVGVALSNGAHLQNLASIESPLPVVDLATVGRATRSTPLTPVLAAPGTPAVLQGTAGSTGTPRTAVLPPESVLANVRALIHHTGADPRAGDVGCSWLPIYHDMGLAFLLVAALTGGPLWLAPTSAFASSPFRYLSWLHDSKATLTAAPNFAYTVLGRYARRAPKVDLHRVRFALNGGEPIDCEGFERFADEMAPNGFRADVAAPSYGLAEASCAVTSPALGTGLRYDEVVSTENGTTRRHALLGQPVQGMEVRVVAADDTYAEFAGRDIGEIEIRGTSMMSGYLGHAPLDPQSWFSTGDLGYLIDDELVICGRAKEIITVAGRNVFPTEIEKVAATVRGVREGAVVAVGTDPGAVRPGLVIAAEFRGPDEPGARSELVAKVASECGVVPSDVIFLAPGTLPRTSSGKLRRLAVRKQLQEANT